MPLKTLRTLLLALAATLPLSGCIASLRSQQHRLAPDLVGQPLSTLTARYGWPLAVENRRTYRIGRGVSTRTTAVNVPVTGRVDGSYYSGAALVPGPTYSTPTFCSLRVTVDDADVIQTVRLQGTAATCRDVLGPDYSPWWTI